MERYLKTGVSHLQLITFLVCYQEFKILTVSMWWHERKKPTFSLQPVKSDSGSQSALCLSIPRSTTALNYSASLKNKCQIAGKTGKGQETLPHLSTRAELLWLKFTFHRISLIAQCWTVHGDGLLSSRSVQHSGSFNNIFLKITLSQKKEQILLPVYVNPKKSRDQTRAIYVT